MLAEAKRERESAPSYVETLMHPSILNPRTPVPPDALFPDAESAYTFLMRPGVALLAFCLFLMPCAASAAEDSAKDTYEALNALRVNPAAVYEISAADRIEFRRGDGHFTFEFGKLAFIAPYKGQVTGAVFSGRGHVVAAPRDPVEKQQMARFLGAPVLDEAFSDVYLRFTDDTATELLRELSSAGVHPVQDTEFAVRWDPIAAQVNPPQSLRILFAMASAHAEPFFYAAIEGNNYGPFDLMVDPDRFEGALIGQPKKIGTENFYDVWASYPLPGQAIPPRHFAVLDYEIHTSVLADISLDAKAEIRVRAETGGERAIGFQLARALAVDSVTGSNGEPLTFFQNEGMNLQDRLSRGTDYLFVILPAAPEKGSEFTLHFRYRGRVIENAGNGVLFVDARESWYPHFGDAADFANYDLTIRWPKKLKLVATGIKRNESEDGDFHVGHWQSEKPVSVAGFNLGDYVSTSIASDISSVEVYANRQLERSINGQLENHTLQAPRILTPLSPEGRTGTNAMAMSPPAAPSHRRVKRTRTRNRRIHSLLRKSQWPISISKIECFSNSRNVRPRLAGTSLSIHVLVSPCGSAASRRPLSLGPGAFLRTRPLPRSSAPMVGQCRRLGFVSRSVDRRSNGQLSRAALRRQTEARRRSLASHVAHALSRQSRRQNS